MTDFGQNKAIVIFQFSFLLNDLWNRTDKVYTRSGKNEGLDMHLSAMAA